MRDSSIHSISVSLAAGAVLLGCLLPGRIGTWSFAIGAALLPVALIALGARTEQRPARGVRLVLVALALLLLGTLGALILLHRNGRAGAVGLPLQLAGIWLLPSLLTGVGYAVAFSRDRSRCGNESERAP